MENLLLDKLAIISGDGLPANQLCCVMGTNLPAIYPKEYIKIMHSLKVYDIHYQKFVIC